MSVFGSRISGFFSGASSGSGSGFVPYVGATQEVNLSEYGITAGHVQFDTSPTTYTQAVGNLGWSVQEGTLEFQLIGGNVTLQVGQETVVYVKNEDSTDIVDGDVVYIFAASGNRPSVKKASNSTATTSSRTIGIATEPIAKNGFGFITTQGLVHGLNTNAFNEGDSLWLGTTAGSIVNVKPASPLYSVFIGVCAKKSGGDGHIFVYPQVGFNLDELNNVNVPSPSNNDGLFFNSTNQIWENKSVSTALGYTPANAATIANGSQNGLLSSTDWTTFNNGIVLTAYGLLGSSYKSASLSVFNPAMISTSGALANGTIRFCAIYIPVAATITGVRWFHATQGNYTANNYNGVGLYSYSGGTLTLVASSTNDGNIWKPTTNTWSTKALSSTYAAAAGLYFIAAAYSASAEVTAPTIGSAANMANAAVTGQDFTNSAKLVSSVAGTSLPSTQAMSGTVNVNINYGFWLY